MGVYYVSGFPCSDELYHHGVKGQKWGIRLYQNSDGTLTALGKIHYGSKGAVKKSADIIGKAARGVGKIASRASKRRVMNFKAKHPWLMGDDELKDYVSRLELERKYKDAIKGSKKQVSKGRAFVGDIFSSIGKTLIKAGTDNMYNSIKAKHDEKLARRKNQIANEIKKGNKFLEDREKSRNPSTKLANETINRLKRGEKIDDKELQNIASRIESLGKIEARYTDRSVIRTPSVGDQWVADQRRMLQQLKKRL